MYVLLMKENWKSKETAILLLLQYELQFKPLPFLDVKQSIVPLKREHHA